MTDTVQTANTQSPVSFDVDAFLKTDQQPIAKHILLDKYAEPGEEDLEAVYRRVAKGLAEHEAKVHGRTQESFEGLYFNHLSTAGVGAGRIMSVIGTSTNATAINCLQGDTVVLTQEGPVKIRELAGKTVNVYTPVGWTPAKFDTYGQQELFDVTFDNGRVVKATAGHDWPVVEATADHGWHVVNSTSRSLPGNLKKVKTVEALGRNVVLMSPHVQPGQDEDPKKYSTLKIVSVQPTGITEEVFCATEPLTHTFTIEGGILTGNCFRQPLSDSLYHDEGGQPSIYRAISEAGYTMSLGGGEGYNFTKIRPKGARVKTKNALSSGPCSYIDVFDASSKTIESAGGRRGANMGVLDVTHPDIMDFVTAKSNKGKWEGFNVSVGVYDNFMQAVINDEDWKLMHEAEPGDELKAAGAYYDPDAWLWEYSGSVRVKHYGVWVYKTVKAADLWEKITRYTYDWSEPGILFLDTANRENNLWYCESFDGTNPCVTADTRLHTQHGMVTMGELYEKQQELMVTVDNETLGLAERGVSVRPAVKVFMTSPKTKVWRVTTEAGFEIKSTDWHEYYTGRGKIKLKDMVVGDELRIQSGQGQFGSEGDYALGMLIGYMAGDGYFTGNNTHELAIMDFWNHKVDLSEKILAKAAELISSEAVTHRDYPLTVTKHPIPNKFQISSARLARALRRYGINKETKTRVPEIVWKGNRDCVIGYLHGLFEADSTINRNDEKASCSIRLGSVNREHLQDVQQLLSNFGIMTRIRLRKKAQTKAMPDGQGGQKQYECKDYHELIIDGRSRDVYMSTVGYALDHHQVKYAEWAEGRTSYFQKFTTKITSIEYIGEEAVYDTTQADHNSVIFNGIVTGQCGEQFLPYYGCCDLGPLILTRFVVNAFTPQAYFDFPRFIAAVKIQQRLLDNILDMTIWPLAAHKAESDAKRRIGIGYTGIGTLMVLMGLRYASPAALKLQEEINIAMRDTAYLASIEMAKERGPFPLFDAEKYLQGEFIKRLPQHIRDLIAQYGIRNSHLLSIAPTGTVSLAFANNAANSTEPVFTYIYNRKVRDHKDQSVWHTHQVADPSIRARLEQIRAEAGQAAVDAALHTLIAEGRTVVRSELEQLRIQKGQEAVDVALHTLIDQARPASELFGEVWVSAQELTVDEHLAPLYITQPYIDSALSKTINIPADYPYEKFKDVYMLAWKNGLKGVATYRPSIVRGAVLEVLKPKEEVKEPTPEFVTGTLDENLLRKPIGKRQPGDLPSITSQNIYEVNYEVCKLYLTISLHPVTGWVNNKEVTIMRPMEFFVPQSQLDASAQWVTGTMRTLSLLARAGGDVAKALRDYRKLSWTSGPVRCGTITKADGSIAPRFHSSDIAAVGYMLQQMLQRAGFLDEDGNEIGQETLIAKADSDVVLSLQAPEAPQATPTTSASRPQSPHPCPACGAHEWHRRNGCFQCDNCGHEGSCG